MHVPLRGWRRPGAAGFSMGLLFAVASCSAAVKRSVVPIRVRVLDTSGIPVGNASVSLVRGLRQQLASGATDSSGMLCFCDAFIFSPDYQVLVRKPGFLPARQFARLELLDSLKIDVMLSPVVHAPAPSTASAIRVDAEEIARYGRSEQNAFDVIRMLRPDMLPPRGAGEGCAPIASLWVNGRPLSPRLSADAGGTTGPNAERGALSGVTVPVRAALYSIKPEYVSAIEYRSCRDTVAARAGQGNALIVSLKKGVQFDDELGSYIGAEPARRLAVPSLPAEEPNVTNVRGAASVRLIERLESYRYRILGVFDGETGEPIEGAEVRELATGTKSLTSATGTVSLAFLRDGGGPVVLAKPGYRPDIVTVAISPRDTVWLTYLLFKAP